jgi:hypothetical protein
MWSGVWSTFRPGWWMAFGALCSLGAQASEIAVGRVDVQLDADHWQAFDVNDAGSRYEGDRSGVINSSTKLLVLRDNEGVRAVLLVRANKSGIGGRASSMRYTSPCPRQDWFYSEGNEGGPLAHSYQCLVVLPPAPFLTAKGETWDDLRALLDSRQVKLEGIVHLVDTKQAASTGAFSSVMALIPSVALPAESTKLPTPPGVPSVVSAAAVQWGRQLMESVRSSVYSLSGDLRVPALSVTETNSATTTNPN